MPTVPREKCHLCDRTPQDNGQLLMRCSACKMVSVADEYAIEWIGNLTKKAAKCCKVNTVPDCDGLNVSKDAKLFAPEGAPPILRNRRGCRPRFAVSARRPNHVLDDTVNNDSGEEHFSFYERDQNKLLCCRKQATRQAQVKRYSLTNTKSTVVKCYHVIYNEQDLRRPREFLSTRQFPFLVHFWSRTGRLSDGISYKNLM